MSEYSEDNCESKWTDFWLTCEQNTPSMREHNNHKYVSIDGYSIDTKIANTLSKEDSNIISEYPSDALRYLIVNTDNKDGINEDKIKKGSEMVKNIRNISNITSRLTPEKTETTKPIKLEPIDCWIAKLIQKRTKKVKNLLRNKNYQEAILRLKNTFIRTYRDNYLSLCRSRSPSASLHYTVQTTHKQMLKSYSPILPYTTEQIWNKMYVNQNYDETGKECNSSIFNDDKLNLTSQSYNISGKTIELIECVEKWKLDNGLSLDDGVSEITVSGTPLNTDAIKKATRAGKIKQRT